MTDRNGRVFWTAAVLVIVLDVVTKMLAVAQLVPPHVPHRDRRQRRALHARVQSRRGVQHVARSSTRAYIFGTFAVVALDHSLAAVPASAAGRHRCASWRSGSRGAARRAI